MNILGYEVIFVDEKFEAMGNACLRQGKKVKIDFEFPFEEVEETKSLKGNVKISCVDN